MEFCIPGTQCLMRYVYVSIYSKIMQNVENPRKQLKHQVGIGGEPKIVSGGGVVQTIKSRRW